MLWSLLLLHAMVATAIDDKQVDEACTWFQHKDVRTWGAAEAACWELSKQRSADTRHHFTATCISLLAPVYLTRSEPDCSAVKPTLRDMTYMRRQTQKNNQCPASPALDSLSSLLDRVFDDYVRPQPVAAMARLDGVRGRSGTQRVDGVKGVGVGDGGDAVEGRPPMKATDIATLGCYHVYHYTAFTPSLNASMYWRTFLTGFQQLGAKELQQGRCAWQSSLKLKPMSSQPCQTFVELWGSEPGGLDRDRDYLRVEAMQGFPLGINRRWSLNLVESERGSSFLCLYTRLFPARGPAVAAVMKVSSLHAPNTGVHTHIRQTDNLVVYSNVLRDAEVTAALDDCLPQHAMADEAIPMMLPGRKGVFLADDNGVSFGMHRCQLVGAAAGMMLDRGLLGAARVPPKAPRKLMGSGWLVGEYAESLSARGIHLDSINIMPTRDRLTPAQQQITVTTSAEEATGTLRERLLRYLSSLGLSAGESTSSLPSSAPASSNLQKRPPPDAFVILPGTDGRGRAGVINEARMGWKMTGETTSPLSQLTSSSASSSSAPRPTSAALKPSSPSSQSSDVPRSLTDANRRIFVMFARQLLVDFGRVDRCRPFILHT